MKKRKLFTSLMLSLWIFSSFAAGPSRTLTITDDFNSSSSNSVREIVGVDVDFSGKMAGSENGNLMLLLEDPVVWTYLDEAGEPQSIEASVFECDPVSREVVAAYSLLPVETDEAADPEPAALTLSELQYDADSGTYLGLDSDKPLLYVFEYGPDQEVTVMVEKTRMVEVVVPPESLLNEIDEMEPAQAVQSGPEVATEEELLESTATDDETVVEDVPEPEVMAEAEASDELNSEEMDDSSEAVVVQVEEASEQIEVSEDEAVAVDEASDPALVVIPEVEKTIDVQPVEVPEILEEVEEPIVPVTKWVEETYEEPEIRIEHHKFGPALKALDLSDLEMDVVVDLLHDATLGSMMALGKDSEGTWMLKPFSIEGDRLIVGQELITFSVESEVKSAFIDPQTNHWVLITSEAVQMHARDGRFLRKIADAVPYLDIAEGKVVLENETESSTLYIATDSSFSELSWARSGEDKVHHVPGEFASIQAAVNASASGDWILLSPGVYEENVVIDGKSVQLASYYQLTNELYFPEHTVLKPTSGIGLTVSDSDGSEAYISGLRISGSEAGIQSSGNLTVEHSELISNVVGVTLMGGTAMISDTEISGSEASGIVYRDATASLIERCNISENGGSGIAIDITPYDGVLYRTVIRRNTIRSNAEAGVLFRDQPITTQREFRIENNFILENGTAGVEVYLDQPDPENLLPTGPRTRTSVYLVNNTIVGNPVGVLHGGNYRMVNNIIAGSTEVGVKDVRYHSVIIRNLFWENKVNVSESNFNESNNREEDPLFVGDDYILSVRSPAKRAGIPGNLWNDSSDRSGADIGASR